MATTIEQFEPQRRLPMKEPEQPAPRDVTPATLLHLAVSQNADVEKLERLMALHERWEAGQARKAFVAALSAFKREPPTVVKNKHAGFESKKTGDRTEYEYATLDQVSSVIGSSLSNFGLTHSWQTTQDAGGLVTVACILTHEMGHSERVSLQAGLDLSGSKNNIQALGSTVTYLERYTLLAVTGLAAKGQDDDGRGVGGAKISAEQKDAIIARMRQVGADTANFLRYLGVPNLDALPAEHFSYALDLLNKKAAQKTKEGG